MFHRPAGNEEILMTNAQWHLLYLVATLARAWEQAELQPKTHGLATVAT